MWCLVYDSNVVQLGTLKRVGHVTRTRKQKKNCVAITISFVAAYEYKGNS